MPAGLPRPCSRWRPGGRPCYVSSGTTATARYVPPPAAFSDRAYPAAACAVSGCPSGPGGPGELAVAVHLVPGARPLQQPGQEQPQVVARDVDGPSRDPAVEHDVGPAVCVAQVDVLPVAARGCRPPRWLVLSHRASPPSGSPGRGSRTAPVSRAIATADSPARIRSMIEVTIGGLGVGAGRGHGGGDRRAHRGPLGEDRLGDQPEVPVRVLRVRRVGGVPGVAGLGVVEAAVGLVHQVGAGRAVLVGQLGQRHGHHPGRHHRDDRVALEPLAGGPVVRGFKDAPVVLRSLSCWLSFGARHFCLSSLGRAQLVKRQLHQPEGTRLAPRCGQGRPACSGRRRSAWPRCAA